MATQVNEARLRLTARDETAQAMTSAARNLERLAQNADRSQKRIEAAAQKQSRTMAGVGAGIGAALGGREGVQLLKDSYTAFADADRTLGRIGNTAGKSKAQMAGISQQLAKMADDFALPVGQVVQGLDALTASGRSLEESMEFLPSVAAAAQASGAEITDMAGSAGALATSMGIAGDKMGRAFDILVAGGQAGNFELKDMARYLPSLAPLAASVGYKGEEGLKKLVAILQVVRKQTGDAGQAADATRDVFSKMGSEEVNNRFAEMGVDLRANLDAAAKAGKDLPSVFLGLTRDTLMAAAGAEGFEGAMRRLPLLFGDVQMQTGMRALLTQPGAVRDLIGQLGKVDGTTLKNLANITDDAKAGTDRLANAWLGVQKAIGETLTSAKAPEGLNWLSERLKESAAGFDRISKLGLGDAIKRAMARDELAHQEQQDKNPKRTRAMVDRDKAAARVEEIDKLRAGPYGGAYETAQKAARKRLAEAEAVLAVETEARAERLKKARTDFERADTGAAQTKEGLPPVPELPPALPPELRDGAKFEPTSFSQETAQEDTQRAMARDISGMRTMWDRAIGPNAPTGRFGGLIQRASLTSGDPSASTNQGIGAGTGGGGGAGEAGPRGGTAGSPNMRYGGGSGATPGGSNTAGDLQPGQGGPGRANYMNGQHGAPGSNLVQVKTPGGKTAMVHRDAAPSFQKFVSELESQGYKINSFGGHNHRNIRGGSKLSQHAYGNAIDINPAQNPMGPNLITDMPKNVREMAAKYGLTWGGDFRGRKDAMHFEWNGTRPWEQKDGKTAGGAAGRGGLTGLIEAEAKRAGIDPRVMHGIRAGESGHRADYDRKVDAVEDSHGPFQLNRRGGLGAEFEQQTGQDARNPASIPAQARWVAEYIAKQRQRDPNWNPGRKWMGYRGLTNPDPRWGESGYQGGAATAEGGGGAKPPSMFGASPPSMGGDLEASKAKHDQLRAQMEKPIETPVKIAAPQMDRMRERGTSQARRETDRELRNARLTTYSDVGVG